MLLTWTTKLGERRSAASIAAFRFAFGALIACSSVRFILKGWPEDYFGERSYFFPYYGFEWVHVFPEPWMTAAYFALASLGVLVAVGLFFRPAAIALFALFTYLELTDVTNYLNHYYLVSLLALLLAVLPTGRMYSFDALRLGAVTEVPLASLAMLRFQVGVVYVFAAIAKLQPDWLLHAQPLGIWLASREDAPIVGWLLQGPWMAFVASWAGFLNDALAVPLLLCKRTRWFGYAMVVVFHTVTHLLFDIGIFPITMIICATIFFEPDWPQRVLARINARLGRRSASIANAVTSTTARAWPRWARWLACVYVVVQVLMPLRAYAYGGDVLWHEQGMRFGWRVMIREKAGDVRYITRYDGLTHDVEISPRVYVSAAQEREMSGQPDMIQRLAHHIADDLRAKGRTNVIVRVRALVSLNGRRGALLIDPTTDLSREPMGLASKDWILPKPNTEPLDVFAGRR